MVTSAKVSSETEEVQKSDTLLTPLLFDWLVVILTFWFVSGVHIDGWAHNNLASELESFFTPWHAILYSGYGATSALILFQWARNLDQSGSWKNAIPEGYFYSFIGIFLFMLGGTGDLLWHEIFGIETNVEALYSPTHILLGISGTMIVSGPLRKAWLVKNKWNNLPFKEQLPAILSAGFTISAVTFFYQFAVPTHSLLAGGNLDWLSPFGSQGLGVTGSLLYTITIIGFALLLIRRLDFPFGSFGIIMLINGIYSTMMRFPIPGVSTETSALPGEVLTRLLFPIIALITGFGMDYLARKIKTDDTIKFSRIFGIIIPVLYFSLFFTVVIVLMGTTWRIHLWSGIIVVSSIMGYILSVFVFPSTEN